MAGLLSLLGLQPDQAPMGASSMQATSMGQDQSMQQPKGLFGLGGNLGGLMDFSDPQRLIGWQLIANGQRAPGEMMTGVPELAAFASRHSKDQRERAETEQAKNSTVEWLKQNAPEYMPLVASGAISPKDAFGDVLRKKQEDRADATWKSRLDYETSLRRNDPAYLAELDLAKERLGQAQRTADPYKSREEAADRYGLTPGDPRRDQFIFNGEVPKIAPPPKLLPTELKELWSSEDEIPALDSSISSLNRALELNDKTYHGMGAGKLGSIGTSGIPGVGYVLDEDKAKATAEFGKIMSLQAIENMTRLLKGATTDTELEEFKNLLADPTTPPDIRSRTITRMLTLAQRQRELKSLRINELRGGGVKPTSSPMPAQITAVPIEKMSDEDLKRIANGG